MGKLLKDEKVKARGWDEIKRFIKTKSSYRKIVITSNNKIYIK